MASVTYTNARKYRHLGQDEEEPEQSQSEAIRQRILKELLCKQLSKHISLEQQLNNQKEFVKADCEESVTANTSGLASFEDFKSVESLLNVKKTLKSCGLTDSEILLLLDEDNQSSALEASHARRQRLQVIEDKLVQHSHGEPCLQEAKGVPVPEKDQQPTTYQDFLPEGHPMNHLKEIAEKLFPTESADHSHSKEHIREKRQHTETLEPAKVKKHKKETSSCIYLTEKPKSYWDMEQIPKVIEGISKQVSASIPRPPGNTSDKNKIVLHINKNTNVKVDQTKPFIMTLAPEDLVPLAAIEANRKTIQELKDMEKFKNYNEGTPSCTLFIKNLCPSVTAKDLASLMGHFESSQGTKILYRILGGRMKGQAFVTFPDEAAASSALRLCTGYLLHGRPLVAVFGKQS